MAQPERIADVVRIHESDQLEVERARQRHELQLAHLTLRGHWIKSIATVLAAVILAGGGVLVAEINARRDVARQRSQTALQARGLPPANEVGSSGQTPEQSGASGGSAAEGKTRSRHVSGAGLLGRVQALLPAAYTGRCVVLSVTPRGSEGVGCSTPSDAVLAVFRFRDGVDRNAYFRAKVRQLVPTWRRGQCDVAPPCSDTLVVGDRMIEVAKVLVSRTGNQARLDWIPFKTRMYGMLLRRHAPLSRHLNAWLEGPLWDALSKRV